MSDENLILTPKTNEKLIPALEKEKLEYQQAQLAMEFTVSNQEIKN